MSSAISRYAKQKNLVMVDAKKNVTLELRESDIAKGVPKNPGKCALARACKRELKGVRAAFFYKTCAWLEFDGKIERYSLPRTMQSEIVSFDRAKIMDPGEYQLSKPCPSQTIERIKARTKKRPGRHHPKGGDIKRSVIHVTKRVRAVPHSLTPINITK